MLVGLMLVTYVPQDPSSSLNPALRIRTQILEVLETHGFGASPSDREARVAEVMSLSDEGGL